MSAEIHYHLLKLLENNPNLTQRQMAKEMGLSLGKFNYCLKELVKKGIVKIERFTSSDNKAGYLYLLTPHGLEQKANITANFLQRKMAEYELLKREIQKLSQEINSTTNAPAQIALQPTDDR
jgi:EPS-associated MarR family transcriptional regulator